MAARRAAVRSLLPVARRRFLLSSSNSSPRSSSRSLFSAASGTRRRRQPVIPIQFTPKDQRRSMFIQVQSTPNPASLIFIPGKPVMEIGSSDFPNARVAMKSPLAKAIFDVDGVTRVFFGSNFVTVTKSDEIDWDVVKPEIFAAIMDFYSSGKPLFNRDEGEAPKDTAIQEDDDETVVMIKELLETRIRPAVRDDGGDIEYRGFDRETGVVQLKMQGACSGCPSSGVTLKSGIENMLTHYIPEVKRVQEVVEEDGT